VSLDNDLAVLIAPKDSQCRMAQILAGLEGEAKTNLETALTLKTSEGKYKVADRRITVSLRSNEIPLGDDVVANHRGKKCKCYKEAK